jgi:phosphoglycolate phosphatase-like HAD superfamily hydrolase
MTLYFNETIKPATAIEKIKAVVLDIDGVLFDEETLSSWLEFTAELARYFGLTEDEAQAAVKRHKELLAVT